MFVYVRACVHACVCVCMCMCACMFMRDSLYTVPKELKRSAVDVGGVSRAKQPRAAFSSQRKRKAKGKVRIDTCSEALYVYSVFISHLCMLISLTNTYIHMHTCTHTAF